MSPTTWKALRIAGAVLLVLGIVGIFAAIAFGLVRFFG